MAVIPQLDDVLVMTPEEAEHWAIYGMVIAAQRSDPRPPAVAPSEPEPTLKEVVNAVIRAAVARHKTKSAAARALGIARTTLLAHLAA